MSVLDLDTYNSMSSKIDVFLEELRILSAQNTDLFFNLQLASFFMDNIELTNYKRIGGTHIVPGNFCIAKNKESNIWVNRDLKWSETIIQNSKGETLLTIKSKDILI